MYLNNKLLITPDTLNYQNKKALAEFTAAVLQKHPPEKSKYGAQLALVLTIYQALVNKITVVYQEEELILNGHDDTLNIKISESYNSPNRKINGQQLSGLWQPELYVKIQQLLPGQQPEGNCVEIANLMQELLADIKIETALYLPSKEHLHVYLLLKLDGRLYQLNPKVSGFALRPEKEITAKNYFKLTAEEKEQENKIILKFYDGLIKYQQNNLEGAQQIFNELADQTNRWYVFEYLALLAGQDKDYARALYYFELAEKSGLPQDKKLNVKEKKQTLKNLTGV